MVWLSAAFLFALLALTALLGSVTYLFIRWRKTGQGTVAVPLLERNTEVAGNTLLEPTIESAGEVDRRCDPVCPAGARADRNCCRRHRFLCFSSRFRGRPGCGAAPMPLDGNTFRISRSSAAVIPATISLVRSCSSFSTLSTGLSGQRAQISRFASRQFVPRCGLDIHAMRRGCIWIVTRIRFEQLLAD